MKYLLIIITIISTSAFCQDSAVTLSKFENFTSAVGKMYKYETIEIGNIRDIKISISKVTDIASSLSVKAIRVTQNKSMLGSVYSYGILTIDMEEAEGVYKALEYYLKVVKEKPKYLPGYYYFTTNDIVASCTLVEGPYGSGWYVGLSQRYHYLKTLVPNSSISVKNKDIDDLVDLIKKAKETEL
jgi:hypothetical protein